MRWACDRRYIIARDIYRLLARYGGDRRAREICVAHLAINPVILWRYGNRLVLSGAAIRGIPAIFNGAAGSPAVAIAARLVDRLLASIGTSDVRAHAAVFEAFEALAEIVDLDALARRRPRVVPAASRPGPRQILVIKLGALGDFVQALGPAQAVRQRHQGDRIILLTGGPFAEFAQQTKLFDEVLVDRHPEWFDIKGWLALGRLLRQRRFDRVYDLQTSDRSAGYAWLLRLGRMPEWSGIVWRCSHPHANRDRDRQHTLDRQAEQLLMAGVHPVPLVDWLPPSEVPPVDLAEPPFVLLIPGSSPGHAIKRWPAENFGKLARWARQAGYLPVIVGVRGEEAIARVIRNFCPEAVDLVGRTDLESLAALAASAALSVGNDTGAAHVAAAGGNPLLVLFSRASIPALCAPRGVAVQILSSPDLADLTVETVIAAARGLVGLTPAGADELASG